MLRIAVFVSGGGTNLQALIDGIENKTLTGCEIATVISSKADAFALERARKHQIPCVHMSKKLFENEECFAEALKAHLQQASVDLLVTAGYLSLIPENVVTLYTDKIINVHPALMPAFSGKGFYGLTPHKKVLEYGAKVTGATVHFADCEYDHGAVIAQKAIAVLDEDTPESLQLRVMKECEQVLLPAVVQAIAEGRIHKKGRQVQIIGGLKQEV